MNALNGSEKGFQLLETEGQESDLPGETDRTRDGENRKEEKQAGFVFFSCLTRTKQAELAVNPHAAVYSAHAQLKTDGPPW